MDVQVICGPDTPAVGLGTSRGLEALYRAAVTACCSTLCPPRTASPDLLLCFLLLFFIFGNSLKVEPPASAKVDSRHTSEVQRLKARRSSASLEFGPLRGLVSKSKNIVRW